MYMIRQKTRKHVSRSSDRHPQHKQDDTTEHNYREKKAPHVAIYGQVDHLLDGVEVWVVEIAQEPQNAWTKHLS